MNEAMEEITIRLTFKQYSQIVLIAERELKLPDEVIREMVDKGIRSDVVNFGDEERMRFWFEIRE